MDGSIVIEKKPVKLAAFDINHSLLHVLKVLTGDKENDIVKYFYEIGMTLFIDSISRKNLPQRCNRTSMLFYKDTDIQVRFEVWSSYFRSDYDNSKVNLFMRVQHPNTMLTIKGSNVVDMITETELSLSNHQIMNVEKPEERLYKCLKKK